MEAKVKKSKVVFFWQLNGKIHVRLADGTKIEKYGNDKFKSGQEVSYFEEEVTETETKMKAFFC